MQLSNKHNLVLYVDQELVEKSRNLGFNLSKTFENHLKHLITQFSAVNSMNNYDSTSKDCEWWAEPDLNRRPLARKANVLSQPGCLHTYRPFIKIRAHMVLQFEPTSWADKGEQLPVLRKRIRDFRQPKPLKYPGQIEDGAKASGRIFTRRTQASNGK